MLTRIDLRGSTVDPRELLPRAKLDVAAAVESVRPICEEVRRHGSAGVREMTQRYDGVDVPHARVPAAELNQALEALGPALRAALEECIARARTVHSAQLPQDVTVQVVPGGTVTERHIPVGRVGLYVPGGLLAYPSSVVMNVVPAQVAGVESLAVVSPPQRDGLPDRTILGACALLGVEEVYAVGGAQAVAMFAYGTDECPRADVVTGPGNVYVAAAKRLLRGIVGFDAEAGPTEVAILADDSADPDWVAADLIAQAEHDPNASCLLVTDSEPLADEVDRRLAVRVPAAHHRERIATALTNQSATVVVDDLDQGLVIVDEWAAEHLEVITRDAAAVAARVRAAGAVFVGAYSPVPLGDYLAGSNHILPTGGTARHTSGLTVSSFLRSVHVVDYDRDALAGAVEHITALAGAEDLLAHAESVQTRFRS